MNFKKTSLVLAILGLVLFFGYTIIQKDKIVIIRLEDTLNTTLPSTMYVAELTSLRKDIGGKPSASLTIGTEVNILEEKDNWVLVSYSNYKGWLERNVLTTKKLIDKDIFESKRVLQDGFKEIKTKDKSGNEVVTQKKIKEYVDVKESIKKLYELGNVQFSPIEKKSYPNNPKINARAIYISLYGLRHLSTNTNNYIELAKKSNINAFVIDIKDDFGWTLFTSNTAKKMLGDHYKKSRYNDAQMKALITKLKENNIYLIGRLSTFKDTAYAESHPNDAILDKRYNKTYQSRDKVKWLSAYDRNNWYYNIELAKEAADLGFNEILFDYVRFPDQVRSLDQKNLLDYKNTYNETKPEAIQRFLKYAHDELSKKEVYTSASIFGQIGISNTDESIGQHWESLSVVTDYLNPMSYPSHFIPGSFNYKVPDANPYGLMKKYSVHVNKRDEKLENPAIVVMWIQGFTASWVKGHIKYGPEEVKAQIRGLKEEGLEGYLVWNAASRYNWDSFKDSEKTKTSEKQKN